MGENSHSRRSSFQLQQVDLTKPPVSGISRTDLSKVTSIAYGLLARPDEADGIVQAQSEEAPRDQPTPPVPAASKSRRDIGLTPANSIGSAAADESPQGLLIRQRCLGEVGGEPPGLGGRGLAFACPVRPDQACILTGASTVDCLTPQSTKPQLISG